MDNKLKNALLIWMVIIVILSVFSLAQYSAQAQVSCPGETMGDPNAKLSIQYFESPFCFYCWMEKPVLKEIINKHGDKISLSSYDIRYCKDEVAHYNVLGTPTFIFRYNNEEVTAFGFISQQSLEEYICRFIEC